MNDGAGGYGMGVWGSSTNSAGVYGTSVKNMGVFGVASGTDVTNIGVYGYTASSSGYGGFFQGRGYFSGNLGIGDLSPVAALTVGDGDKFQVSGADGDLTFSDDLGSITFPAADATNSPMIHMFASGEANATRMVLAHSPAYPTYGLQYEDSSDRFHFLSAGTPVETVDLHNQRVGIGTPAPSNRLSVAGNADFTGNVGIGNAAPVRPLDVANPQAIARLATTSSIYGSVIELKNSTANPTLLGGINFLTSNDSVPGQIAYQAATNEMTFRTNGAERVRIDSAGDVGIGTSTPTAKLDVAGTARVDVLEIDGGADLSEKFVVAGIAEPGMVLAIDPDHPGALCIARGAYDKRVAGIVSGAGGIKSGMVMGQSGSLADGDHHVALTGRVYCWCDASEGGIEPGDLLTTSDTPGHAMRVSDQGRSAGAVLGKAMTSLKTGRGLVLVLVSLQ
jgi:hypothetical protein